MWGSLPIGPNSATPRDNAAAKTMNPLVLVGQQQPDRTRIWPNSRDQRKPGGLQRLRRRVLRVNSPSSKKQPAAANSAAAMPTGCGNSSKASGGGARRNHCSARSQPSWVRRQEEIGAECDGTRRLGSSLTAAKTTVASSKSRRNAVRTAPPPTLDWSLTSPDAVRRRRGHCRRTD